MIANVKAPPENRLITGNELMAMGEIGPCELVEGEIVMGSPAGYEHGWVEFTLGRLLGNFVYERKLGWVGGDELGIYTRRNPDTVRAGDVVFVSKERSADRPRPGYLEIAPDLVVEVVSPGDSWSEIQDKIEEYFAIGVRWVWVIEPRKRAVRVYRSPADMEKLVAGDTLEGEGPLAGFRLPVATIFE